MILQLTTKAGHPVFRAPNPLEKGELEKREYGKKSTRFSGNERNIGLLLRTIKSVLQLSIYEFIAHWTKYLDEDSSEAPSSDDSDSSGTLYAIQTLEIRRLQKKITMSQENVSDNKTSFWRKQSSSTSQSSE